jgi:hypothetical protein
MKLVYRHMPRDHHLYKKYDGGVFQWHERL